MPGGGCANCGFSNIGNSDPRYDTIRFPPYLANEVVIYLSEDLSFTDPEGNNFYSIWENIEFDGQVRNSERTKASLIGVNWVTQSLSGGFVRNLSTSNLSLMDTDLNTGQIRLEFLGSDNTLTLQNSSITIAGDSPGISSLAPMTIDVTGGSNSISNLTRNYNPTSLTLNIASGASLEFIDSGVPLTTVTADRLYFRTPVTGLVDGGTLSFNLSNVYFNSTRDFRFSNNAQLSLVGFGTLAEFENLQFANSDIDLDRNTRLSINNQLRITDTDVSLDYGANFTAEILRPYGVVNFSSPGTGSRFNVGALYFGDGGSGQLDITGVSQTNLEYLYFVNGSGSSLSIDSELNISDELYAIGNPQITLLNGANLNLLGASNPISSQLDLDINTGATFSVGRSGQFAHISSANILNNGEVKIDGDYLVVGNTTISGTGAINVFDNGRILLRSPQSTLALDNPLTFGSIVSPLTGGELHSVLDGGSANSAIGRILYGSGDIDLTLARSLTVSQQGSATASELDGKYFTVVAAQNNAASGTLLGANNLSVIEDGNIPALIDFQIVNLNTNGHPDLTLQGVIQPPSVLMTHPSLVSTTTQTTNPNSTNLVSAIITSTTSIIDSGISVSTALNSLTNSQLSRLPEVHAEPYASFMTVGLEQMDIVFDMVSRQTSGGPGSRELAPVIATRAYAAPTPLSTQDSTPRMDTPSRSWVDFAYLRGDVEGQDDLGSYSYTLTGLAGGVDLIDEPTHSFGVYLGFGTSALDEHDSIDQDIIGRSFHIGAYGQYALPSAWVLDGVLGYMYALNESERVAPDVGLFRSGTATADFDSHGVYAGLAASKPFAVATDTVLTPSLGLVYSHLRQEGFEEHGARDFNWDVDAAEADALVASIGLDASHRLQTAGGGSWSLDGMIRYHHDFFAARDDEHEITLRSPLFGSFTQVGQNRGSDGLSTGLGATGHLNENTSFGIGYTHTWNSNGAENALAANIVSIW